MIPINCVREKIVKPPWRIRNIWTKLWERWWQMPFSMTAWTRNGERIPPKEDALKILSLKLSSSVTMLSRLFQPSVMETTSQSPSTKWSSVSCSCLLVLCRSLVLWVLSWRLSKIMTRGWGMMIKGQTLTLGCNCWPGSHPNLFQKPWSTR